MGTAYLIASAGLFALEIIFQLYAVAEHSKSSTGIFVALLTIVMAPLIVVNFVSAIQVTRTQDFSGKNCGRIICIILHVLQLGVIWRSLKLLILFEDKDWLDFLKMRLFHCAFHSLPFAISLTYSMFVGNFAPAVYVLAVVVTMLSSSVALATYQTGSKLYEPEDFGKKIDKIRKHAGVVILCISSLLLLISRCSAIVLFSVAEPYWIALPLCIHFGFLLIFRLVKIKCSEDQLLSKIAKAFYMSVVCIFEMVRTDYKGVKCSYVFFYTVMLIENLTFGFYWMLTANYGEMLKLMTVVVVLLTFIVGVVVKCASSGCIYNIESDILTDAFTNPELKQPKKDIEITDVPNIEQPINKAFDKPDNTFRELKIDTRELMQTSSPITGLKPPPVSKKPKRSKPGSSSASSGAKASREYYNQAFVNSQGSLSALSQTTPQGSRQSRESKKLSSESEKRSRHSKERSLPRKPSSMDVLTHTSPANVRKPTIPTHRYVGISKDSDQVTASDGRARRSMIKVSDRSIHASPQQTPLPVVKNTNMASNADLASSNSRYSRNTHTLQSSVRNYGYNGFDDPFREKRQQAAAKRNKKNSKRKQRPRNGLNKLDLGSLYSNPDYSLDSSELYPSISSDTSSMTSYSNTRDYWNIPRHKRHKNNRMRDMYDGYQTDVSNSDDFSFTDYSLDDSCSCSESSDSDGALTWPPSHTSNLADMYNIPDKVSSTDNIIHWLDTMASDASVNGSFSTLPDVSIASDTDMSLSALKTFEVKKEHKRFKKLLPKPKEVFLKFRSLNYKDKERPKQGNRPYYPKKPSVDNNLGLSDSNPPQTPRRSPVASMPLPVDNVQESIV